jgi:hypothetical protein
VREEVISQGRVVQDGDRYTMVLSGPWKYSMASLGGSSIGIEEGKMPCYISRFGSM